jgi:hypothetical protein
MFVWIKVFSLGYHQLESTFVLSRCSGRRRKKGEDRIRKEKREGIQEMCRVKKYRSKKPKTQKFPFF